MAWGQSAPGSACALSTLPCSVPSPLPGLAFTAPLSDPNLPFQYNRPPSSRRKLLYQESEHLSLLQFHSFSQDCQQRSSPPLGKRTRTAAAHHGIPRAESSAQHTVSESLQVEGISSLNFLVLFLGSYIIFPLPTFCHTHTYTCKVL